MGRLAEQRYGKGSEIGIGLPLVRGLPGNDLYRCGGCGAESKQSGQTGAESYKKDIIELNLARDGYGADLNKVNSYNLEVNYILQNYKNHDTNTYIDIITCKPPFYMGAYKL